MLQPGTVHINNNVPFGELIYWWLQLQHKADFQSTIRLSECYGDRYLAWEEVRKGNNPFFVNGTGFEGYFVGMCQTPEAVFEHLLSLGQEMLINLTRLHPFERRFRATLMEALTGKGNDWNAISEWSAEFGATVARLRCNVSRNQQADAFQRQIYQLVRGLPPIQYQTSCHTIRQHYDIYRCACQTSQTFIDAEALESRDQEAWQVVKAIGMFGHPLLRLFVSNGNSLLTNVCPVV